MSSNPIADKLKKSQSFESVDLLSEAIEQNLLDDLKKSHEIYTLNKIDNHKSLDGYFSVSQFSGNACLRKQFYKALSFPVNQNIEINHDKEWIFDTGHYYHDKLQSILKNKLSDVETFMQDDDFMICGSTDGVYTSHRTLIDFKSCNLNVFNYVLKTGNALKNHIAQTHNYARMYNAKIKTDPNYRGKQPLTHVAIMYINKNQAFIHETDDDKRNKLVKSILNDVEYLFVKSAPPKNLVELKEKQQFIEKLVEKYLPEEETKNEAKEESKKDNSFYDSFIKIIVQPLDQTIINQELAKVTNLRDQISLAKTYKSIEKELEEIDDEIEKANQPAKKKDLKQEKKDLKLKLKDHKYKIPNKISNKMICGNCEYYETCRVNKLK